MDLFVPSKLPKRSPERTAFLADRMSKVMTTPAHSPVAEGVMAPKLTSAASVLRRQLFVGSR